VLQHLELMAKEVMPHFRARPIKAEARPIEISTAGSV
jgi:hypothetical protein